MARAASIRVRGVTYSNPDEAYVAADELEHHADTLAANLRRSGKEGEADTVVDRGHADANRLRSWARERTASEAESTPQPAGRPTAAGGGTSRSSTKRSRPRGQRKPARHNPSSGPAAAAAQTIYVRTGARQQVASWGSLGWTLIGLTLGMVLLTLFLTPRGVGAFSGLTGALAGSLTYLVDPVDPLAPRKQVAAAGAAMPGSYATALRSSSPAPPARRTAVRAYSPKLAGVHV